VVNGLVSPALTAQTMGCCPLWRRSAVSQASVFYFLSFTSRSDDFLSCNVAFFRFSRPNSHVTSASSDTATTSRIFPRQRAF
jgi:hypothetical protein